MTIPLCDLKTQYLNIRDEILAKIDELCLASAFIKGKYLQEFEQAFLKEHNTEFGLGCSDGTSAVALALEGLGIGQGDEVILPSHTFVATAEAVCHVGATPIFSDIKSDDYTIDPNDIKQKLTKRTKAIIPVHLYGTPCDMDEILDIANGRNLKVIEDTAQAHFAKYKEQYVGTFGDAATYSFYPGKNLGAYGDAGFIICKTQELEQKLKRLVDHGRLGKFDHDIVGYNRRMDAIQAAILSIKLKYIQQWTTNRQNISKCYNQAFKKLGFKVIEYANDREPTYHVYCIEVENRDRLRENLDKCGIKTGIHYPKPVHQLPAFQKYATGPLPVTERIVARILSLPIYPEMPQSSVDEVLEKLSLTTGYFQNAS